jgi:hypothetical protein
MPVTLTCHTGPPTTTPSGASVLRGSAALIIQAGGR